MGTGFTTTSIPAKAQAFLDNMRSTSAQRNQDMVKRVNEFLSPLVLNYDEDVLPLTPNGNATERHLCLAYARKAASMFPEEADLRKFWSEKLGVSQEDVRDLPEGRPITDLIRAKTMKQGGVGYVKPDSGSFPNMAEMNQFVLLCGAIPTFTWLDGCSLGEQSIEELVEVGRSTGVAAFNIIPDRNYTPGQSDQKLENLKQVVQLTQDLGLPLLGGTEMNSPGQKFVDDFSSAELAPLQPVFIRGSWILHAHSTLQRDTGMGYLSDWASNQFSDTTAKNEFYATFGELYSPRGEKRLKEASHSEMSAGEVTELASQVMSA